MWTAIAAMVGSITTMLSGLGGYLLAGRNDEKRDQRTAERELAARRDARIERLADQSHQIQRETLFELQDELTHLSRILGQTLLHDRKAILEAGAPAPLPNELDTGFMTTMQNVQRLQSRVLNDTLREAVVSYTAFCSASVILGDTGRSPAELLAQCDERINATSTRVADLNEQLGAHIRTEINRLASGADLPEIRRIGNSDTT